MPYALNLPLSAAYEAAFRVFDALLLQRNAQVFENEVF